MRYDLRMDDAPVENTLDSDGLTLGNRVGIFSSRPEIDQRPAAAVLDDELVTKNLGNVAPNSGDATGWGTISGIVTGVATVGDGNHTIDSIVFRTTSTTSTPATRPMC